MRRITNIVIHCSDSEFGNANTIREWHVKRGWSDIGYHFVITNGKIAPNLALPSVDGSIECGRRLDGDPFISDNEVGAHALGYNASSIGICLIGTKNFTHLQFYALERLVCDLIKHFGLSVASVIGHYETTSGKAQGKTCPNFDMEKFRLVLSRSVYLVNIAKQEDKDAI